MEKQKGKQRVIEVELNPGAEKFMRSKLLGKYMVRILFRQNNNKFEDKYLKKLERRARWNGKEIEEGKASFSGDRTLKERYCYSMLGY